MTMEPAGVVAKLFTMTLGDACHALAACLQCHHRRQQQLLYGMLHINWLNHDDFMRILCVLHSMHAVALTFGFLAYWTTLSFKKFWTRAEHLGTSHSLWKWAFSSTKHCCYLVSHSCVLRQFHCYHWIVHLVLHWVQSNGIHLDGHNLLQEPNFLPVCVSTFMELTTHNIVDQ